MEIKKVASGFRQPLFFISLFETVNLHLFILGEVDSWHFLIPRQTDPVDFAGWKEVNTPEVEIHMVPNNETGISQATRFQVYRVFGWQSLSSVRLALM